MNEDISESEFFCNELSASLTAEKIQKLDIDITERIMSECEKARKIINGDPINAILHSKDSNLFVRDEARRVLKNAKKRI